MMKQIHAFETKTDYDKYEAVTHRFQARLDEYQTILQETYQLIDVPKGIVWTSAELATTVFSDIPIPAFTNKDLIYISPDVAEWRTLFLSQLDGKDVPHIRAFYETLTEDHVLTIAGHELTHHLDLFVDEFDDEREDGIWFEEGMCEYLPRKHLLSDEAFKRITLIETELVELFQEEYGARSIDQFGSASYAGSLSSIMFDYWRSFLAIHHLIEERYDGNVLRVFEAYRNWHEQGRIVPLSTYFNLQTVRR